MYDYPQLKKDIDNSGVSILEVSNTTKEYIREMNKLSFKNMISSTGSLYLNLIDGYDTTLVSKMIYKIVDINKTMHVWHQFIGEGKKLTYKASDHERLETTQLEKDGSISYTENYDQKAIVLWYISGSYEKLTILRKWLVDNYKTSIFQMWYEIELQTNPGQGGVVVTKIHQELTKIYLELYKDLEEVQNFGREYNSDTTLAQTFRLQVYEEGCFISPHEDGNDGQCSMLLYTNEDYVEGMGGELVCTDSRPGRKKEITVPPTIGTLVIVDFKNNPTHAVNAIKEKDWLRTTIGCWWPPGNIYN
jgi:hypothetical protein